MARRDGPDDAPPAAPHSHLIEFPEALEVFFSRIDEVKRLVGPAHAAGIDHVGELMRVALAARERGDAAGAMRGIMDAMQAFSSVVSGAMPDEGPMMRAMAAQFGQAMQQGAVGDAKAAAEVMRVQSGSTVVPRKR